MHVLLKKTLAYCNFVFKTWFTYILGQLKDLDFPHGSDQMMVYTILITNSLRVMLTCAFEAHVTKPTNRKFILKKINNTINYKVILNSIHNSQ